MISSIAVHSGLLQSPMAVVARLVTRADVCTHSVVLVLDDYGTDRLNYYYSTMVIMVLSVTITAKQYVGSPLQCWVPA
ncbi:hypothetical protein OSTOST_14534, partial [Ostertagia ostertagi]